MDLAPLALALELEMGHLLQLLLLMLWLMLLLILGDDDDDDDDDDTVGRLSIWLVLEVLVVLVENIVDCGLWTVSVLRNYNNKFDCVLAVRSNYLTDE